ncbi:AraC family transcriptional regulator [Trinickia sp. NRRL B-1857]|uniref:AraC family transcriptional regulator n=1 Tax=Trinickia sp. NRRL B-1857 TaxID=3162879 RepID=UPI003D2D0509
MTRALIESVKRYTERQGGQSPFVTPIDGVTILRADRERHPSHLVMKPALCVVVQGAKWTTFGGKRYDYRAGQALVVSVELPAMSRIVQASPDEPYLCVVIEFDLGLMREVMEQLDRPPMSEGELGHGVFVTDFDGPLADCVQRAIRLLDTPRAIPVIAPMIMREIGYWLLTGAHGGEVAKLVLANGHVERVVSAIHDLRNRFTETVRVEELASVAQMSLSAFHRQFKALTSMTPLQYQKQLRLLEARHLMLTGAANAEAAAYRVGYESPSQFSREYARMFGAPPRRDIAALATA